MNKAEREFMKDLNNLLEEYNVWLDPFYEKETISPKIQVVSAGPCTKEGFEDYQIDITIDHAI